MSGCNEAEALSPEEDEARQKESRDSALSALAVELAASRSKAIADREESGVEDEWTEDEEFYDGIDDINRGETRRDESKPMYRAQPAADERQGSTVFPNITRPYTDAAAARVGDMLLPTDDKGWAIKPTPIPELGAIADGKLPREIEATIARQSGGDQAQGEALRQQAIQMAKDHAADAKDKADKATSRLEDWHVEGQWHGEVRKVIEDCARLGVGVLKGPCPAIRKSVKYAEGQLIITEAIVPLSRRIDPWSLYPDGGCGENIHNGDHVWERDDITYRQLSSLRGVPGYLDDQIDEALKEGPYQAVKLMTADDQRPGLARKENRNLYEIWYFHGRMEADQLRACGCDVEGDDHIDAQVTLVNNRVIKAIRNPLDTGDFPYDVMVWQQRPNSWAGRGVPRQIRTPQRMVTAATRCLMDNAGRAGGPQVLYQDGIVEPENGQYEVVPWKVWRVAEDAQIQFLDHVFRFVAPPMYQAELTAIIMLGMKLAEDVTGLPLIMQGQQGSAPDTLGGMQLVHNNASVVLRRLARLYDDRIIEPHIRRYYAYLLQYGENDDEKGDCQIDARGSSALVSRELEQQALMPILQASTSPIYGLDPKKTMREYLKTQHLDPARFEFDDEEWQKVVESMGQPQDPRLQVAEMQIQAGQAKAQAEAEKAQMNMQYEAQQAQLAREQEVLITSLEAELEQIRMGVDKEVAADKVKASLADTVMKIRAQRELAMQRTKAAPQVASPAYEPVGRAPDGEAFQR